MRMCFLTNYMFLYYFILQMADVVARSHGGDGGSEPPPNPRRIGTNCERKIFSIILIKPNHYLKLMTCYFMSSSLEFDYL